MNEDGRKGMVKKLEDRGKMSQEYCVECGKSYAKDEVFHIKIFNRSWTCWCFNCATKQLKWSYYRLVPREGRERDIHIKSIEEKVKEDMEKRNTGVSETKVRFN